MKVFFTIVLLAAIGAGGYYYWFHMRDSGDGLGRDNSTISTGKSPSTATAAPSSKTNPSTAKTNPKPTPKAKSAPKKQEAPKSEIDLLVEKKYPMPKILPLNQITKNWSAVPANAYPRQITASVPVAFALYAPNGQKIGESPAAAGTPLKPVRLVGENLTVASLANASMQSQVPVSQTNFKALIENRYNESVASIKGKIMDRRAKAKAALLAAPDRLASLQNSGPADSMSDPRFAVVKASINRGEAHPASLEEAKSFRWNGSERIGGEMRGTYDTVSVHFEVKTIFGDFPTDYKCLIRAGQVVGWIDPITEEKITKG